MNKRTVYELSLGLWLAGAMALAIAQFFGTTPHFKAVAAMAGFASLYIAVLSFGALGITSYREYRRNAHKREMKFALEILSDLAKLAPQHSRQDR